VVPCLGLDNEFEATQQAYVYFEIHSSENSNVQDTIPFLLQGIPGHFLPLI
jgi:hypothetical protein